MSGQREDHEMDGRLSRIYRELARELAPRHLNKRVLGLASNPVRSQSRLQTFLARWTTPTAWFVAFSLCVVVALETTRLDDPGGQMTNGRDSVSDRFVPQDVQTIEDAQTRAGNLNGPDADRYPSPGATRSEVQAERSCTAIDRESAQTWFDCIRNLRKSNKTLAAEREYELFVLEYPDYPHR